MEISVNWYIVNPRFESAIEEFKPLVSNMEDQWLAQEQMLESKACCYTSEVEKVSAKTRNKKVSFKRSTLYLQKW